METSTFSSSYTSTIFYLSHNDGNAPRTTSIPIQSSPETPIPTLDPAAAIKIQSAYRSHLIRSLIRRIRDVAAETDRLERLIQRQDTVDAVRRNERERLLVSEALMALILRLDSVPGFYPPVRDLRRSVSRRIVGLQEVLDAVTEEKVCGLEGFPASWEEIVMGVGGGEDEGEVEVERARETVFRCLERFLSAI